MALMIMGCADRSITKVDNGLPGNFTKDIPASEDMDILFVVDNSAGAADKQAVLAQSFATLLAQLDSGPFGRPNLHVGVVTTSIDIGTNGFEVGTGGCQHPDLTQDGRFQRTPGAGATPGCTGPNGPFIVDVTNADGTRSRNYTGELADTFACISQVGASGCQFEAPLEAMKRALDRSLSENAGFVRAGAYLMVVIVTDEDDCSAKLGTDGLALFSLPAVDAGPGDFRCQPRFAYHCDSEISAAAGGTYTNFTPRTDSFLSDPNEYAGFLATIKDPNQIVVVLIAGDVQTMSPTLLPPGTIVTGPLAEAGRNQSLALEPSCRATIDGNPTIGRPAIRLGAFIGNFGDHGSTETVCQSDYSASLIAESNSIFAPVSPCLEGTLDPIDAEPQNPGVQVDCDVFDVQEPGPTENIIPLRSCRMLAESVPDPAGPQPCWYTKPSPTCQTPSGLAIEIRRDRMPPTGTFTRITCH